MESTSNSTPTCPPLPPTAFKISFGGKKTKEKKGGREMLSLKMAGKSSTWVIFLDTVKAQRIIEWFAIIRLSSVASRINLTS